MHRIGYYPLLMVSRMCSRWLNIFMLVFSTLSGPGYSFVRASRIHDMLLLEMRMRTTRGHILQEVVMHVIDVILEKILTKENY